MRNRSVMSIGPQIVGEFGLSTFELSRRYLYRLALVNPNKQLSDILSNLANFELSRHISTGNIGINAP